MAVSAAIAVSATIARGVTLSESTGTEKTGRMSATAGMKRPT